MASDRYAAPERPEAVVLCGIQGSGKTTFYRTRFAETHARCSLDELKTRRREREAMMGYLAARRSFVVDNTNPSPAERSIYIRPAVAEGIGCWASGSRPSRAKRSHATPLATEASAYPCPEFSAPTSG